MSELIPTENHSQAPNLWELLKDVLDRDSGAEGHLSFAFDPTTSATTVRLWLGDEADTASDVFPEQTLVVENVNIAGLLLNERSEPRVANDSGGSADIFVMKADGSVDYVSDGTLDVDSETTSALNLLDLLSGAGCGDVGGDEILKGMDGNSMSYAHHAGSEGTFAMAQTGIADVRVLIDSTFSSSVDST
ncbi:MAG TPA: hypothetical protein VI457_16180 [Methylococcaceae bacterium]|nr:hypothetical protein [Methylococcaceae bacterium]